MIFKLSYLNSNLALTLGYLNPALNNSVQKYRQNQSFIVCPPVFRALCLLILIGSYSWFPYHRPACLNRLDGLNDYTGTYLKSCLVPSCSRSLILGIGQERKAGLRGWWVRKKRQDFPFCPFVPFNHSPFALQSLSLSPRPTLVLLPAQRWKSSWRKQPK